ncbi:MAG: hypothetical protein K6F59_02005 [Gammaproteobacteria bacterium]|nr:hypothetical protein [Gammaproteobacteria bacterium]
MENNEELKQETKEQKQEIDKAHKQDLLIVCISLTICFFNLLAGIISEKIEFPLWLPFLLEVIGPIIFSILSIVICIISIRRKVYFAIAPFVLSVLFASYWIFIYTQRK